MICGETEWEILRAVGPSSYNSPKCSKINSFDPAQEPPRIVGGPWGKKDDSDHDPAAFGGDPRTTAPCQVLTMTSNMARQP